MREAWREMRAHLGVLTRRGGHPIHFTVLGGTAGGMSSAAFVRNWVTPVDHQTFFAAVRLEILRLPKPYDRGSGSLTGYRQLRARVAGPGVARWTVPSRSPQGTSAQAGCPGGNPPASPDSPEFKQTGRVGSGRLSPQKTGCARQGGPTVFLAAVRSGFSANTVTALVRFRGNRGPF